MTPADERGWKAALANAPKHGKILLVEDDANLQRVLARLLEQAGHEVITASSAEEADMHLSQDRFDVCLLDIGLPGMSGFEYLQWVLRRDPELAVIMLTGVDDADVARKCIESGARTYLVKPMDEVFLRLAIRDALAMRRLLVSASGAETP